MCRGRLVMLDKPSGTLRPIAVGECLLRLLDKVLLKQCADIWQSFAPVQLGVSIAGGAQTIKRTKLTRRCAPIHAVSRSTPTWRTR
jgi:hypothetical protein